jgi:hypothetical protein
VPNSISRAINGAPTIGKFVGRVDAHREIDRMSERAAGCEITRVAGVHGVTPNDEGDDEGNERHENGDQRRAMLDQSDTH